MNKKDKYKFDTLEELQEKYPIGYIISSVSVKKAHNEPYYNNTDLEIIYKKYGKENVTILDENYAKCFYTSTKEEKVEGYIFDGKHWRPAYDTWDGWVPYMED